MKRTTIIAAAAALTGPSAGDEPTWQEALADEFDDMFDGSDLDEFCQGMSMLGADTPEESASMGNGFDIDSAEGDRTIAEAAAITGQEIPDLPGGIDPCEVTVGEFAVESARIQFDMCGL